MPNQLICPHCQSDVISGWKWCRHCYRSLIDLYPLTVPEAPSPQRTGRKWLMTGSLLLTIGVGWFASNAFFGETPATPTPTIATPATPTQATATSAPPTSVNTAVATVTLYQGDMAGVSPTAAQQRPASVESIATVDVVGTYRSPSYGYQISWDATWTVQDERSWKNGESGFDQLLLTNGISTIALTGVDTYRGDASTCLNSVLEGLAGSREVQGLSWQSNNTNSVDIVGHQGFATSATYTSATDNRKREAYIACVTLVPGSITLAIMQTTPLGMLDETQTEARQLLLSSFRREQTAQD